MGASAPPAEDALPEGAIPTDRVTLGAGTLVITDLHLAPLGDERTEEFVRWCDAVKGVPVVVCLGDLFDAWVGRRQARVEGSRDVLAALRRLVERGIAVHLVPGNRDLVLDKAFDEVTGGTLHAEGFVGELDNGTSIACVHGDALCTLDVDYQRLRRLWLWGPLRFASRHAPLWFARWIGRRMRRLSETRKPLKLPEEKSIRPAAVRRTAAETGAGVVVCGHAHEARDEALPAGDGGPAVRWIVVGAWGGDRDLLEVGPGGALELASTAAPTSGA
ncbi:MAG: metallophosphoesterase [Planctomycetota bacterium]